MERASPEGTIEAVDGLFSGPARSFRSFLIVFSSFLRPFSYSRKKKDQKEPRRSARGRFSRESPQGKKQALVPCGLRMMGHTTLLDGSTRQNPPILHRCGREIDRPEPPAWFGVVPHVSFCGVFVCTCGRFANRPYKEPGIRELISPGHIANRSSSSQTKNQWEIRSRCLSRDSQSRADAVSASPGTFVPLCEPIVIFPALCLLVFAFCFSFLADCSSQTENQYRYARNAFREDSQSRACGSVQRRGPMFLRGWQGSRSGAPVREFALCIWTAPRLAATFGSFWSRQKERAAGREIGEM